MEWYKENIEDVLKQLSSNKDTGLTKNEAKKRLEKYGPNELKEKSKQNFLSKIINQFKDFLVIILIVASIVSALVGEVTDSIVIISIVIINAALGILQEGKALKALESLQKMTSPNTKVIRNKHINKIPSSNIVPGDIVILEAGDIVPADLRLIESSNLRIQESSLTGESIPVEKNANQTFTKKVPLGDRKNISFMNTTVTYGRGKGVVIETSSRTEIGKIAEMLETFENNTTPLQKKLDQLGKYLGIGCIIICGLIFLIGLLQGRNFLNMFMIAISLAVAAIPEGLPAIVTIVLALGMNKMVKRNAIVKKLLAVETLGCTTTICSDKTGTLTQNEMTVVKIYTENKMVDISGKGYEPKGNFSIENQNINPIDIKEINFLISIGALCNDANLETKNNQSYKIIGDPTEGALITLGEKAGLKKQELNSKYKRIDEIPFDSDRKMMTTFHQNFIENKIVSFTKGAPDIIIKKCNKILLDGKEIDFTNALKEKILNINSSFSKQALRVLGFSYRIYDNLPQNVNSQNIEKDMIFVGLAGMIDPPRNEVIESIKLCKKAGIKTVMITGDYKETAFTIAKDLGIVKNINETMTGSELDNISNEELRKKVKTTKVYARVSPQHKVKIVDALKKNGEITAMTGDGVNDAPALKKSDIGISMGITGTDVAKNTAEVILTDDNFSSIVSAIEEGRIIYSNIRKFVLFLLSCNIAEILIIFLSILFNIPVPLLPIQLLWLNLITDSFPALALGVEKKEPDIMNLNPRNPDEPILNKTMLLSISIQSIAITIAVILAYIWGLKVYGKNELIIPRTIAFTTLITAELIRAYSSRSEKYTLFEIGFFSNKTLVVSTLFSLVLLLIILYIPILQPIFHTSPLRLRDWSIILRFCIIPIISGELSKIIFKKIYRTNTIK